MKYSIMAVCGLGIVAGLEKLTRRVGIVPGDIDFFMHGTTVATNAILEGKGVKTALITTEGFRDVLHIMRQDRPKLPSPEDDVEVDLRDDLILGETVGLQRHDDSLP